MKNILYCFAALLLAGSAYAQTAVASDITTPQKRIAFVELANKLVKSPSAEELQVPEGLMNPFNPVAEPKVEVRSGRPSSDIELLELLADQLQPTGVMGRDGTMVLLLKGQKGVKLNSMLTLSFDGTAYEVEVSSIDRINFSLRYNQAEITRPIKPGKNP